MLALFEVKHTVVTPKCGTIGAVERHQKLGETLDSKCSEFYFEHNKYHRKMYRPIRVHRNLLYAEQAGMCIGCGIHLPRKLFHIDHIVPGSKGGSSEKQNLQLLCSKCNGLKGIKSQREFLKKLRNKQLNLFTEKIIDKPKVFPIPTEIRTHSQVMDIIARKRREYEHQH